MMYLRHKFWLLRHWALRHAADEYLRITANVAMVRGVQFNAGAAISKFSPAWQDEPDFRAAHGAMWADMEAHGHGNRTQSEEKNYVYLTSPWKLHHVCWAALHASKLGGDFVDIGSGLGVAIRCAINYLHANNVEPPTAWCVDRWDERDLTHQQTGEEIGMGLRPSVYVRDFKEAATMFGGYPSCRLVQGTVPDCLDQVEAKRVSFVYSDLNIAAPEIAAAEYLWDRMVPGGIYMIDDYGGFPVTRKAFDDFARSKGVKVASLAEGPGMMIKPPA
jgi:hypothetical protein